MDGPVMCSLLSSKFKEQLNMQFNPLDSVLDSYECGHRIDFYGVRNL
jgi:hypothetical protein